ncbi:unnamed protein product [Adineta steineri]|uniref:Uncharacterized protein n=2 Tax=Adineta steineri TaxID=433720 RepID=A0A815PYU5_9BILA|nr:unnamed protein product [Adineta steineri]CAF1455154.1 unnamed protein product [Adineta steineri]CAF3548299.1 unnamed protein product [Adineta steineri]
MSLILSSTDDEQIESVQHENIDQKLDKVNDNKQIGEENNNSNIKLKEQINKTSPRRKSVTYQSDKNSNQRRNSRTHLSPHKDNRSHSYAQQKSTKHIHTDTPKLNNTQHRNSLKDDKIQLNIQNKTAALTLEKNIKKNLSPRRKSFPNEKNKNSNIEIKTKATNHSPRRKSLNYESHKHMSNNLNKHNHTIKHDKPTKSYDKQQKLNTSKDKNHQTGIFNTNYSLQQLFLLETHQKIDPSTNTSNDNEQN